MVSETMTVTSDGSAIEARIRSLKQQLRQRQKEVKRVRNEQNRKRKAKLKQHEEQLKKRLEVHITSDSGPSEKRTTSLQRTFVMSPKVAFPILRSL